MQLKTKELLKQFEKVRLRKWTPEAMVVDLAEEVGELSNAVLVKEGFKNKGRQKADLVDSLCDILFDFYMLSEHYKVDLEKEYEKVLAQLEKRIKEGEFV